MGDTPTPRSYSQILGDEIDAFLSHQGIKNLRVGSPILSILEAAAQSDTRSSQDIFQLLASIEIDRAFGLALKRIGDSEKVPQQQESPASGTVTVSDSSFTKKSSKLFQGSPAPIAGSVAVDVIDALDWPASGSVYLGRGTPNYEGPLAYSSKTDAGTHWTLNLTGATVKFHNTSETAILAQGGNRTIGVGSIVRTPQANVADAVQFKVVYARTIPDGETQITSVLVQATQPGTIGNVPARAIKEFSSLPFTGATVSNPSPFSNGLATERDDDYRERIKNVRRTRGKGTPLAIETAATGITAADENKRISSAKLVERAATSTLYIDDGTGYEERVEGVAIETLIDSALGGEQYFELENRPVARAFVKSTNESPFNLKVDSVLTVKVGGVESIHAFSADEFVSLDNATAYEIVASINSDSNLPYLARTSDAGSRVILFAKTDTNEDIEVIASDEVDANDVIGFQLDVIYTVRPYLNDRLLSKDGSLATYASQSFSLWNVVSGSQTLIVAVDGTPATTYTFIDQDFVDADTGFSAVGRNSPAAWVKVINRKIPGITASEAGGRIVLTSNLGTYARASVEVSGGTLVAAHFFSVGSAVGTSRDYTLNRSTSQLRLERALSPGDRLTIGSFNTRSFLESDVIATTSIASTAKLWFVTDGDAEVLAHGVTAAMTFTIAPSSIHAWGHMLSISADDGTPFVNVLAGDWVVLWDPALDASLQGAHRIVSVTDDNEIIIERRSSPMVRSGHRSVAMLAVGSNISKVMTTGGSTLGKPDMLPSTSSFGVTDVVEILDPNTNRVTLTTPMMSPRAYHTATLLPSGKILVTGGVNDENQILDSIELYDPGTSLWTTSVAVLGTPVRDHAATLLGNGKVLITGGNSGSNNGITSAWVYDPGADSITATSNSMTVARARHRQVLLPNGKVLVAGGFNGAGADQVGCDLFTSGTTLFAATGSMTRARSAFGLAAVGTPAPDQVLAIGNKLGATGRATYEVYSIMSGTWGAETTTPNGFIFEHNNALTMTNGKVVMLHGWGTGPIQKASQYDGSTFTALAVNTGRTDSSTKFDVQLVNLTKLDDSLQNSVLAVDGMEQLSSGFKLIPTANYEGYDGTGDEWSIVDPGTDSGVNLSHIGLAFVRTAGVVRKASVPVGANYTASSIVAALNPDLVGATASVYRTNQLRISTNTFSRAGDIALVTQNENTVGIGLTAGSAIQNLTGHLGSVESGNSEVGTPSFQSIRIRGVAAPVSAELEPLILDTASISVDYGVVGLRNFWDGSPGTGGYSFAFFSATMGDNGAFRTRIKDSTASTSTTEITPRSIPPQPWKPLDRIYLAAPFAIGPNDDLSVMVDNSADKRYSLNMGRRLSPVGNTYSTSNVLRDLDAGGVSIAATFGLDYSFDDFAVYMPSRAVAFNATPNSRLLFRYFRVGPEGDNVRVRFSNPTEPNGAISTTVGHGPTATADVRVQLAGGAARTPTVHTGMNIGIACTSAGGVARLTYVLNLNIGSATRTSDETVLTLDLPTDITDHGLQISNAVWVNSTNGSFSSGLKTITARTAATITYAEVAADAGPSSNIGTVSYDSVGAATFTGSGVVGGDFLRVNNLDNTFTQDFANNTGLVVSIAAGYVEMYSGEIPGSNFTPSGTLDWDPLGASTNFVVFANPANTAAQVTTAVNALAAATNSTTPITMTLLGAGSTAIDRSTPELLNDANAWYYLADGVNWVESTTAPGSIAGNYTLTFKNPISGLLATSADWQNETVVIVPSTAQNVVDWLSTPTVSGLFTACSIQTSSDGAKVQLVSRTPGSLGGVQVQGGLSNAATAAVRGTLDSVIGNGFGISTVKKSDTVGIKGGDWVSIENTIAMPKVIEVDELVSWTDDGLVVFGTTGAIAAAVLAPVKIKVRIERQGDFVALSDMGTGGLVSIGAQEAGTWLRLSPTVSPTTDMPQIATANQGIFRILRVSPAGAGDSNGTLWYENSEAIEEACECELAIYTPDSVMPGDELIVSTQAWGVGNQGTWVVRSVGNMTADSTDYFNAGIVDLSKTDRVTVEVSSRTPTNIGPGSFSVDPSLIKFVEGTPANFIMKVLTMVPNQTEGSFIDIGWDQEVNGSTIGSAAGSIITVRDKLNFPLGFSAGVDGYSYDVGLIGEANRVVFGDSGDTSTYPGVAAAGAQIDISGPLVKRILIALQLRVRSGVTNSDIADRVRSAVATVINQTGIGQPIALSSIIAAASRVVGVVSVTIVSPAFGVGNDLISVQPFEKPLVLNLDQDIQIAFSGE